MAPERKWTMIMEIEKHSQFKHCLGIDFKQGNICQIFKFQMLTANSITENWPKCVDTLRVRNKKKRSYSLVFMCL